MKSYLDALVSYAIEKRLIEPCDAAWAYNSLLSVMRLDYARPSRPCPEGAELFELLAVLTDNAVERGIIDDNISDRDLFDTALMGVLTPRPGELRRRFAELFVHSPSLATEYFYTLSCDTNYIRVDRIKKDLHWRYPCSYGELDISVNLSKPEKDPRAIAAAKLTPSSAYPACQLCAENEGYSGRADHPPRQNHRLIPLSLGGESWFFHYSPYVYYNEHCIVLNSRHTPMRIDRGALSKLLDFVTLFPHYFVGSNADLPIVGGSILSHDHFQGGRYEFPMAKAPVERELSFNGFDEVKSGIVSWPVSILRLRSADRGPLLELAEKILNAWRGYTDASAFIYSETGGEPHNTLTPIARRRGGEYEFDLALRNNIRTPEHPLGVFHPHAPLHHIKKENIGLIEVMGLAVLPSRLKRELASLRELILTGGDVSADPELSKHADWVDGLRARYAFTQENTENILRLEVGRAFQHVLEDVGVFKSDEPGQEAFMRFINYVNQF